MSACQWLLLDARTATTRLRAALVWRSKLALCLQAMPGHACCMLCCRELLLHAACHTTSLHSKELHAGALDSSCMRQLSGYCEPVR